LKDEFTIDFSHRLDELLNLQEHFQVAIIHRGSNCPQCQFGVMECNGMLDLECGHGGLTMVEAAGFS
jgi:hypothetical protein